MLGRGSGDDILCLFAVAASLEAALGCWLTEPLEIPSVLFFRFFVVLLLFTRLPLAKNSFLSSALSGVDFDPEQPTVLAFAV